VEGALYEGGLYDNSPSYEFLKTAFEGISPKRDIYLGVTDVLSAEFVPFTKENLTHNIIDAMKASLSFPGFFPPTEMMGSKFFDGASVWNIDIFPAINKCLEVAPQEDIVVDVLFTSSASLPKVNASEYKSTSMLFRYLDIHFFY